MRLSEICVERPVFAFMLVMFLVVLGVSSFTQLGVDLFPRSDPATVSVKVELPGASPEEVTSQVVMPLEEAIASVSGIDEMQARELLRFIGEIEREHAAAFRQRHGIVGTHRRAALQQCADQPAARRLAHVVGIWLERQTQHAHLFILDHPQGAAHLLKELVNAARVHLFGFAQ